MNNKQALKEYRAILRDAEKRDPTLKRDKPRRGAGWVDYIDTLHRSGAISDKQARSWGNPFNN